MGSRRPPGGPGGIGKLSQKFGRSWEAHADVREGLRRPPGSLSKVVSGREAHPEVQEG